MNCFLNVIPLWDVGRARPSLYFYRAGYKNLYNNNNNNNIQGDKKKVSTQNLEYFSGNWCYKDESLTNWKKTAFKRWFGTKWIEIIRKFQTHIHDKNVILFPTAVAEFKMSRLTLRQRNLLTTSLNVSLSSVILLSIKIDS